MVSRPGVQGQLLLPFSTPIYAPFPYLTTDANGNQTGTDLLFVQNGNIYHWTKGATSASQIEVSGIPAGSIKSENARWARLGHYAYLTYGVAGTQPIRVDLTGATTGTALNPPTAAPIDSLTDTVIDPMTSPSGWTPDTLVAGGNLIINGDFSSGLSLYPTKYPAAASTGGGFDFTGPDVDFHNTGSAVNALPSGYDGTWALLDDPGEGLLTDAPLLNAVLTNEPARYGTQVYARTTYYQSDPNGVEGVRIQVTAYSTAAAALTDALATATWEYAPPFAGQSDGQYFDHVFSFAGLDAEILSYRIGWYGAGTNTRGSGVFVTDLQASLVGSGLTLQGTPSGLAVYHAEPTAAYRGVLGGSRLTRDFGANRDWTGDNVLALGLSGIAGLPAPGLLMRLGLRADGGAVHYLTNLMIVSDDASYASVDISTIPLTVRQAARYLEVVFDDDLSLPAARSPLLTIGPLTSAGDLSIVDLGAYGGAAAVTYVFTEVNAANDPVGLLNVIESDVSPVSLALSPTVLQAQAQLSLSTPVNTGTTHFRIYRTGGVFSDGIGRLIATVSVTADTVAGDDTGFVTWNHLTRTLLDNTPDSYLQAETVVYQTSGRGVPPSGAHAIAAWQGRIWLAVGSTIAASWQVQYDQQDALYFNPTNNPNDPLNAIKGFTATVGQDDGDPIIDLVVMGANLFFQRGYLVARKQHSICIIGGTDPNSFYVQEYLVQQGVGGVGGESSAIVDGILWYLTAAGVRTFNGDKPADASLNIEEELHPLSGTPMNAAALAASIMVAHDRRMHLFAPRPGDGGNTVVHIWDTRQQGWTRDVLPLFLPSVTGAASLSSQSDGGDLVLLGSDGQIYLQTAGQTVDKHLPSDAGVDIPWAAKGRGMGQEGDDLDYWRQNKPLKYYLQALVEENINATFTLDNEAGSVWTQQYTLTGLDSPVIRLPNGGRGTYHIAGISGQAGTFTRIKSLALESVETRTTR